MSQIASEFPRFSELPFELRIKIWEFAVPIYVKDLADRLPPAEEYSWAERRRLALTGSIPEDSKQALRVRILDHPGVLKLRFEENDFETLVASLPISAVCHEARSFVIEFCRPLGAHLRFEYATSPMLTYEETKDGWEPLEVPFRQEAEHLERLLWQPTTLTVDLGSFKSAEHLVDTVVRFFGNKIQRLILDQAIPVSYSLDYAYWDDSGAIPERIDAILKTFSEEDPTLMCVTKDRKIYVSESYWQTNRWVVYLAKHLVKIAELLDGPLESLPQLEHLEVTLSICSLDIENPRIEMVYKRDVEVLAVTSSDPLGWPLCETPTVHVG